MSIAAVSRVGQALWRDLGHCFFRDSFHASTSSPLRKSVSFPRHLKLFFFYFNLLESISVAYS